MQQVVNTVLNKQKTNAHGNTNIICGVDASVMCFPGAVVVSVYDKHVAYGLSLVLVAAVAHIDFVVLVLVCVWCLCRICCVYRVCGVWCTCV